MTAILARRGKSITNSINTFYIVMLAISGNVIKIAHAGCSNQCSGHGTCGVEDTCECFPRFGGPDCSKRLCAVGVSWVAAEDELLDRGKGPAFGTLQGKHAYAECSSKGKCDYAIGECVCYEGYTGVACQRQKCPYDCSGHGRCVSNARASSSYHSENSYGGQYWDSGMTRQCVCDRGWQGFACDERSCPMGADPLVCSRDEYSPSVQRIRLRNMNFTSTAIVNATSFKIAIALTFVDMFEGKYTTKPIRIANKRRPQSLWSPINQYATTSGEPYVYGNGETLEDFDANRIRDALMSLPNFAIPSVNVTDVGDSIVACALENCSVSETRAMNAESEYVFDVTFTHPANSGRQQLLTCVVASPNTDHPAFAPRMSAPTIYRENDTTTTHALGDSESPTVVGFTDWWEATPDGPSCTVEHVPLPIGAKEHASSVCSSRGVCDTASGMCSCFPGYAGEACGIQTIFF